MKCGPEMNNHALLEPETPAETEQRILILAPRGRDAALIAGTLAEDRIPAAICADAAALVELLEEGAAGAIVAEEALTQEGVNDIAYFLASQPPWSDLPFVVLTSSGRANPGTEKKAQELAVLGNITFLERPARPDTVRSSMRAALRARMRQYEMRRRQETLTRVNADLEQFAYSASHDLQEPIRNVAIYSDILSMRYSGVLDDSGIEFLGNVKAAAVRMQTLVADLLSYTQAASITEEAPEPGEAEAALVAALANLTAAIARAGASITYDPLPAVRVREVHLQQIFQNLIGNAIKYRREEPLRIHVSAQRKDGHWQFSVKDNGIGIGQEYQEQIFGLFKRLHTNRKYPGTGIGLAICQRITERYGGRIRVESELGKGSVFFFTVPA
jgi:signal transduction histidine kinase